MGSAESTRPSKADRRPLSFSTHFPLQELSIGLWNTLMISDVGLRQRPMTDTPRALKVIIYALGWLNS